MGARKTDTSGLLQAILASARDYAIMVISLEGRVESWNAGAEDVFGYATAEILGRPVEVLFTDEDRARGAPRHEMEAARLKGRAEDVRWHQRKDGSWFWGDGVMQPMYGPGGMLSGYVKIMRDGTEKHRYENEIARLARIDPLTGLANRAELADRFRDMTAAASRHDQLLLILLVDLDNFKQANDRFGHHVGDRLLQLVAQRIREAVRETDLVARLGGDEFVVLQPDAGSPELGGAVAEKLVAALSRPFTFDDIEIRIGASIGISVYPQDATEPDQLLRKADLALYKIKTEARNGFHYFSPALDEKACKRSRDLAGLRRAMTRRAFSLCYQPKVAVDGGKVVAVEALLRCHERTLAGYPIEQVIALAMEAGLMRDIGLWVLEEACAQARIWHRSGLPGLKICVNLCAAEMADPGLPAIIAGVLERTALAPRFLEVELTEREIFDSGDVGLAILVQLRALGITVAIDDFGTGFSSLSYLSELPVDEIKLDRSFLRNVPDSPQECTVAAAIISLAHGLRLRVVAEGVETTGQADFLRREHCDKLQGFLFCRPLPAGEMGPWLRERVDIPLLGAASAGNWNPPPGHGEMGPEAGVPPG